jgi:hypothetical protein
VTGAATGFATGFATGSATCSLFKFKSGIVIVSFSGFGDKRCNSKKYKRSIKKSGLFTFILKYK